MVEFNESKLTMGETCGRGRRFEIVPMTRGRVYCFTTNNVPEGQRDSEGRTKDMLLRSFRGWHKPIQALITSAEERSIVRSDIYELNPLPRCLRAWSDCWAMPPTR